MKHSLLSFHNWLNKTCYDNKCDIKKILYKNSIKYKLIKFL